MSSLIHLLLWRKQKKCQYSDWASSSHLHHNCEKITTNHIFFLYSLNDYYWMVIFYTYLLGYSISSYTLIFQLPSLWWLVWLLYVCMCMSEWEHMSLPLLASHGQRSTLVVFFTFLLVWGRIFCFPLCILGCLWVFRKSCLYFPFHHGDLLQRHACTMPSFMWVLRIQTHITYL